MYLTSEYILKNPTWHEQDSDWKAKQIFTLLSDNKLSLNSISEIGCGAGGVISSLAGAFPSLEFLGYEISPSALKLARPKESSNLKFFQILSEKDCKLADLLMCIDVVEHVENYFDFLRNLKSLSDWKVFHIPLELSVLSTLKSDFVSARENIGHLHLFDRNIALSVLRETGYSVVDYRFTPGFETWPCKSIKNKSTRLFRRLLFRTNPYLLSKLIGGLSLLVLAK